MARAATVSIAASTEPATATGRCTQRGGFLLCGRELVAARGRVLRRRIRTVLQRVLALDDAGLARCVEQAALLEVSAHGVAAGAAATSPSSTPTAAGGAITRSGRPLRRLLGHAGDDSEDKPRRTDEGQ